MTATSGRTIKRWRVHSRMSGYVWDGPLMAYWEIEGDPISDDYSPDEVTASELLAKWASGQMKKHRNGLIPIHWFVESKEAGKFEAMPFQYDHFGGKYQLQTFLDHFDWPKEEATGEPINWLELPVADKLWNANAADKGGFIQEATGWKPSVLQPFVYLPALLKASGH